MFRTRYLVLPLLAAAACGSDDPVVAADGATPDAAVFDAPTGAVQTLRRPSKSSTVAITTDDRLVMMVNPEDDSLSIFDTTSDTRIARVPVGDEPSAVVAAPDGKTAYVANRAAGTVVKVSNIDTSNPAVSLPVVVGSEPTGLALSPTGAKLYVAEFAEGSFSVIDTASMTLSQTVKGAIHNPFTIAVTNDGDSDDGDELIILPEFFGEATAEANDFTTLDRQRRGRVRIYNAGTLTAEDPILFDPRDSKVKPDNVNLTETVFTSPNQLYAVAIRRDQATASDSRKSQIFIPTVSASAAAPVVYDGNHYPVVLAGDLDTRTEITTGAFASVNLFERILAFAGAKGGKNFVAGSKVDKLFLTEIVDMDFLPVSGATAETSVAYMVSRGADAIQRVVFDPTKGADLGSSANLQVDIIGGAGVHDGCKAPTGLVVRHDGAKAYVNCWVSQNLGVVLLGSDQRLDKAVSAFDPVAGNANIDRGRRFYFTGRGRWSADSKSNVATDLPTIDGNAFGSCGSCHPFGLTDNITWAFAAGPRQTTSMDGTFSKNGTVRKQRALNWSAINDEIHDFERNTRDTSGGRGALTQTAAGTCGQLATETRTVLPTQLQGPLRLLQKSAQNPERCTTDFDDMDEWVKTIRPPRGLTRLDSAQKATGREVFARVGPASNAGNCVNCHSGAGWTVSRVFYDFTNEATTLLHTTAIDTSTLPAGQNNHVNHLENEQVSPGVTRGPEQVACVIRNVGSFGPAELEKRIVAGAVVPSQGQFGFNVPALYGLQIGAPYLHAGGAATLDDLFASHFRAGNDNFNPSNAEKEALKQFLLSIDATTEELAIPAGKDICPASFSAPAPQ